jgi:CRP-like cAMP-binding protein
LDNKPSNRRSNALLDRLSNDARALVQAVLAPVELTFRKQLKSANRKIEKVYFLESGLASIVTKGNGREAEISMVGWEGMVGLPIVFGTDRSPAEAFMQVEGEGQAVSVDAFRDLLQRSPELLRTCLLFAHTNAVHSYYTALANARNALPDGS